MQSLTFYILLSNSLKPKQMTRIFLLSLCLMYSASSCVEKASAQLPVTSGIPVLKVIVDTSTVALQITKLDVEIKITGNIATTIFDITYYNDTDEVLEGEFDFPLADGQSICRYALDINGVLREGVVVEKAKARVAYESTVRRKVDPGLVEKTKGNTFRTRIYPIPAKGYKRVLIGIEQTLVSEKGGLLYRLPLVSEQVIKEFKITAVVFTSGDKPAFQNNTLPGFDFDKNDEGWTAHFNAAGFAANNSIEILLAENKEARFYTEKFEGQTYFYAHIPAEADYRDKKNPSTITILWDVSASAEKRNIKKELELMSMYIKGLNDVTVNLVPFNITTLPQERFIIKNGNTGELAKRLESFSFDGGTQLGIINLTQIPGEEILLFSDGLSTFGKKEILLSNIPVTTVSSSPVADYAYLKFIALQTHGRFINLNETTTENALNEMAKEPLQFINATYNNAEITEFFSQVNTQLQNGFSFAGILKKGPASVMLNFGYGNKITGSKTIVIKEDATAADNIKRIWANTKIARLELEYEKNKADITKLGKQFSIVTQNTSLLVLDRVEDYVEHDIVPPAELRKEYYTLLKEKLKIKTDEKAVAFEEAVTAMNDMKDWYKQKKQVTAKDDIVFTVPNSTQLLSSSVGSVQYAYTDSTTATTSGLNYTTASANSETQAMALTTTDANQDRYAPPALVNDAAVKAEEAMPGELVPNIQLKAWKADAVYLKELDKATPSKYYETYLSLKKYYPDQPSFYVDVARYLFQKNNKQLALQVLSNVTEMKLENPELLRTVANQLVEFGETALAVEVFKEVLSIREEEPQAYRDLALAYNEAGKYQEAVELLYKVVLGNWDIRFNGIKPITLNEMNAIISGHRGQLDLSGIDKKLLQSMPLDVRIVIGWSSNDSDIDLWITDPAKEKCYYQNATTSSGGRMSDDATQGYGPEEFILKKAAKGNYIIEVNLYGDSRQTLGGPITIQAELFTNFGKPTQKREVINCRVTSDKEVIKIGTLKFDNSL
jgi:tetratricopeptide (TPR) repeat protein